MDTLEFNLRDTATSLLGKTSQRRLPPTRRRRLPLPFLLAVMLPTLLAAFYYFGIASPQYVSEAQFVVRGQSNSSPGMLSSLLQTAGGGGSATEDTYVVQNYMMSRDAASYLIRTADLRAIFNRPGADILARFPSPFHGRTFEHFFWHYQHQVMAELDTTTGISTLTVQTFRPEDSQRIAAALMAAAESLVNQMNARQRENIISTSQHEVANAERQLRDIAARIGAYRNREALLDPMKQSAPILKDINDLQTMLSTTQLQITQLQESAPNSPLLSVYQRRAQALTDQIARAGTAVTGSDQSLVPKITAYDDLTIQRELLEKQLATSTAAFETAKVQADHQQLFLDEVVQPNRPDYAAYPRSIVSTLIVFVSFLGIFLMARLLIAGAREHHVS